MQIQIIDFPSDSFGETGKLRDELCKVLRRASTSETSAVLLRKMLGFAVKKLKDADEYRASGVQGAITHPSEVETEVVPAVTSAVTDPA